MVNMQRLFSKKVFDLTTLEIILASFVVEKCHFQRNMFAMEICDNLILNFLKKSIQFGSMETCFILKTDVSEVITF